MFDDLLDRRRLLHVVTTLVVVFIVVPLAIFAVPQVVGADHSYVVLSSSMSPTIGAGDVVIVREVPPSKVEKGDVITFRSDTGGGPGRITHRVDEVVTRDGERRFRTKGDANEEADQHLVPPGDVVGRVAFWIPFIGYFVSFAGSDLGIVTFVIVPSVLLIANEAWTLYRGMTAERSGDETDDASGPDASEADSEPTDD